MITIDNYFDATRNFIWDNYPEAIRKGHDYVKMATDEGAHWTNYYSSESVKRVIDLYLTKLNELVGKKTPSKEKKESPTPKRKAPRAQVVQPSEPVAPETPSPSTPPPDLVERIPEELRFIRRFVNMDGKSKTKDEILRFINALQKAIVEKRIRKTSAYAEQIRFIQDKLIEVYNSMKAKIKIELKPDTHEALKKLTGEQKVMASINFIKRYIGLNGKTGMKEKAHQLLDQINRAIDKGRITDSDPYIIQIDELKKHLHSFITGKGHKFLEIEKAELSGLLGILEGTEKKKFLYDTREKRLKAIRKKGHRITFKKPFYPWGTKNESRTQITVSGIEKQRGHIKIIGEWGVDTPWYNSVDALLNSIDWELMERIDNTSLSGHSCACSLNGTDDKPMLMNSMDFANMQFVTIGLKGKWHDLIGDPSPNFTAMVFGKPKMGKSYLCIDFAGYLARHHGKVLYVAKEEGLDSTLQKKLADKNVAHPNLFVSAELPVSLKGYDFIFLDSVNRLGLLPPDLLRLKSEHTSKSFIFVFQSTKDGNFRGANSFQHDVDVVIEVPEKGIAMQYGRFNQGGKTAIF
jgi:hypothetical protein